VKQGGALNFVEMEVREQEKSLVVLCTRSELKADAIIEEAAKKTPPAASCIRRVRVTTWCSSPSAEGAQVHDAQHGAVKRAGARS
jgi:hypothetical protein